MNEANDTLTKEEIAEIKAGKKTAWDAWWG